MESRPPDAGAGPAGAGRHRPPGGLGVAVSGGNAGVHHPDPPLQPQTGDDAVAAAAAAHQDQGRVDAGGHFTTTYLATTRSPSSIFFTMTPDEVARCYPVGGANLCPPAERTYKENRKLTGLHEARCLFSLFRKWEEDTKRHCSLTFVQQEEDAMRIAARRWVLFNSFPDDVSFSCRDGSTTDKRLQPRPQLRRRPSQLRGGNPVGLPAAARRHRAAADCPRQDHCLPAGHPGGCQRHHQHPPGGQRHDEGAGPSPRPHPGIWTSSTRLWRTLASRPLATRPPSFSSP